MRVRALIVPLTAAGLVLTSPLAGACADGGTDAGGAQRPPWMAGYEAAKDQPIGMTEADVKAYLTKQLKSDWVKEPKKHEKIWNEVLLLMTPAWKVDVPAFHLSKYEVTNAQWERFLEDRTDTYVTKAGDTLESLSAALFRIADPGAEGMSVQRGWRTILARNSAALMPVLNPKGDAKWDPLMARAQEQKLPDGIKISYPRYMPPPHWTNGVLPDHQRRKPMHFLSWEQATDFCAWAGFHLPTEFEWEHAARGPEGRWFPWGNEWDPLRAVWIGFNEAAIAAAAARKPDGAVPPPPVTLPGMESDPPRETPSPVEVDGRPEGATPEGVLHMAGNMSEFTSTKVERYPGSKTTFAFFDGTVVVARGGNFQDRAELLLSADRNCESHQGALLPSHSLDNYGFRIAAYPVPGADLTFTAAQRFNDPRGINTPRQMLPLPAGVTDKKEAEVYAGLDAQLTAGILERQVVNESTDHVFVTGRATGIAFLPVRGFSQERVRSPGELQKLAADPDRPVVLGVLVGTERSGFTVVDAAGGAEGKKVDVAFADPRFVYDSGERVMTQENIGAVLVLEGERVAVYAPNSTLPGKAKYRQGLIGHLELEAMISAAPKDASGPTAEMKGNTAVLTATIPWLDRKGQSLGRSGGGVRVTLHVPFVREMPAK